MERNNQEPQDNTRVNKDPIPEVRLYTPQELREKERQRLHTLAQRQQSTLYDKDKIDYYKSLQNFYNNNVFGYGIQGKQTNYNPYTSLGQQSIQANFDYSKSNAIDFLENIASTGLVKGLSATGKGISSTYRKFTKGIFDTPTKKGFLGTLKQYSKNPIGSGAEALVVNNTPTTVGKITQIPVSEMTARNQIPNALQSKYLGYVRNKKIKLPTYIQNKVKVLDDNTFNKHIGRLDKLMEKSGFRRVKDPNVQYRAYTNGQVVVDDVSPGNVGLTWSGKPKMIDFNLQTVPEWLSQGFSLKKGGKVLIKD